MPEIAIKRVYEESSPYDGYRVLVDRLWPRGISKEAAQIDEWNKDLAPSTELRKWFGHDPARWDEFSAKYMQELKANGFGNEFLQRLGKEEKNNAGLRSQRPQALPSTGSSRIFNIAVSLCGTKRGLPQHISLFSPTVTDFDLRLRLWYP